MILHYTKDGINYTESDLRDKEVSAWFWNWREKHWPEPSPLWRMFLAFVAEPEPGIKIFLELEKSDTEDYWHPILVKARPQQQNPRYAPGEGLPYLLLK